MDIVYKRSHIPGHDCHLGGIMFTTRPGILVEIRRHCCEGLLAYNVVFAYPHTVSIKPYQIQYLETNKQLHQVKSSHLARVNKTPNLRYFTAMTPKIFHTSAHELLEKPKESSDKFWKFWWSAPDRGLCLNYKWARRPRRGRPDNAKLCQIKAYLAPEIVCGHAL
jgi:hypothetical protein